MHVARLRYDRRLEVIDIRQMPIDNRQIAITHRLPQKFVGNTTQDSLFAGLLVFLSLLNILTYTLYVKTFKPCLEKICAKGCVMVRVSLWKIILENCI